MTNDFCSVKDILNEIEKTATNVDENKYQQIFQLIKNSDRIFVTGEGRSGLIGKMFAMRLKHLGFKTYVVGETITPALTADDLLVIASGSGETKKVIVDAKTAQKTDSKILLFSASKKSTLSEMASQKIIFSLNHSNQNQLYSEQFGGSLFEQSLLIFLDSLVSYFQKQLQINNEDMSKIHTNLE